MSGGERFKRVREEEEEEEEKMGCKRFCGLTAEEEELLQLLEDAEVDCSVARNLDSEDAVTGVMRSLEEEIGVVNNFPAEGEEYSSGLDVGISGSEVVSSPVDLGYLLEASDDELGIPPTVDNNSVSDEDYCCYHFLDNPAMENSREDYGNLWQFEDQTSDEYGLLEFGFDVEKFNEIEGERGFGNSACMLFEHGDVDQSWRRETAACGM